MGLEQEDLGGEITVGVGAADTGSAAIAGCAAGDRKSWRRAARCGEKATPWVSLLGSARLHGLMGVIFSEGELTQVR